MKHQLNYGCLPEEYSQAKGAQIVIIPVRYDGTSTWIKGAAQGPEAIIEASANMELYDIETDSEVYKRGILTERLLGGEIPTREMIAMVSDEVRYYLGEGKFNIVIGGEHSISIGAVQAHAQTYQDLTVLQLDAHTDLRDEYNGSKYNHACVMARVKEVCPIVQVGIRSMDVSEKQSMEPSRVFLAKDTHDNTDWIEQAISGLSDSVYLTIDLDVFDPSIMPSTGTPEPGGLGWYQVLRLLKAVSAQRNIVGADIVELCPDKSNRAPDFLAAKLIYKLLSYRFEANDEQG